MDKPEENGISITNGNKLIIPGMITSNSMFFDSTKKNLNNPNTLGQFNLWYKKNSWKKPFHLYFIFTLIILILFSLAYFLLAVRSLPNKNARIGLYVIGVILILSLYICLLYTTIVDAQNIDCKNNHENRNLDFVKITGIPVINSDDLVCGICQIKVSYNTKHCKPCNKCVNGFDHHCDFLSTCIGKRNYISFLSSLVLTLIILCLLFAISSTIFIFRFTQPDILQQRSTVVFHNNGSVHALNACAALNFVIAIISFLIGSYTLYLIFFHARLIYYGLPTWKYLDVLDELRYDVTRKFNDVAKEERDKLNDISRDENSPIVTSLNENIKIINDTDSSNHKKNEALFSSVIMSDNNVSK